MTADTLLPAAAHHAKVALRRRMRQMLSAMGRDEAREQSSRAVRNLMGCPAFLQAETVMTFLSLSTEVDTTQAILECWRAGKRVVAPRVSYECRRMMPVEINGIGDLETGPHGLRQPLEGPPVPLGQIDLILVPGLAFDLEGRRIGRGGGFYDRFLSHPCLHAMTCGLVFDAQVVDCVPVGDLDRPVDMLVTDHRVTLFQGETCGS